MKLADLATGSDWIVWIVFAIFAVLSIILLSGHGYFLLFYFLDMEAGSFLDIIRLQMKKRKNMMKRSYAEQWELECLL